MNPFPFLLREIIYNGHLQSLSAVGVAYISSILLGFGVNIPFLIIVYLLFQPIYFYDRYHDVDKDEKTNQTRSEHLRFYRNLIPTIVAIALILLASLITLYSTTTMLILSGCIVVFGFLYPTFFKGLTRFIPFFKNVYVALVFAILVFLPQIFYGSGTTLDPLTFFLFLFIFVEGIIMQIILDLKDIESDKEFNLKTLPVLIGVRKSVYTIYTISILVSIISLIAVTTLSLSSLLYIIIGINFLINILATYYAAKQKTKGFIFAGAKFMAMFLAFIMSNVII